MVFARRAKVKISDLNEGNWDKGTNPDSWENKAASKVEKFLKGAVAGAANLIGLDDEESEEQPNKPVTKRKPSPSHDRPNREERSNREERTYRLGESKDMAKWTLLEAEGKNTHMTHLEDLVFYEGLNGAKKALNHLASVAGMLSGHGGKKAKVTTKWDGSPAIFAGKDPKDGRFFVATKSIFNKSPKLNKTPADIRKNHESPGLQNKLMLALKHFKKLGIEGILQGDILFAKEDLKTEKINGESYIVFKPQLITYAVPEDSKLAKQMLSSEIGVVWHTQYVGGPELGDMSAQYGPVAPKSTAKVFSDDATYKDLTGLATLTAKETDSVRRGIEKISGLIQKVNPQSFNNIMKNKEFKKLIEPFVNSRIKSGEGQVSNATQFLKDFINYYDDRKQKEIDKLKTGIDGPAGQARLKDIESNRQFIEDNSNALLGVLAVYKQLIQVKQILIRKLNRVESIGMFYKTDDGYEVADPEGFVAIDKIGNAVKLVDRLEFSRRNFLDIKAWK